MRAPSTPPDSSRLASTEQVLARVRDVMIETWAQDGNLEYVVELLAKALRRTTIDPCRLSLIILPTFAAIDGLQWVWSAAAPDCVESSSKPYGFLDQPEHRQSVLHEVLTSGQSKRLRLGCGPTGYAFLDHSACDGATDYLAVLLPRRNAAPSVLSLMTERPGGWSEGDLELLESVTNVLSLLVEVFETRRLLDLTATDPLTGLANRRQFDSALRQTLAMCQRSTSPLSLLYFDVDHFKAYNDFYGHPTGDDCLVKVAKAASSVLRATDLLARVGGEEFAVILPSCHEDGAAEVAERMRVCIEQLEIPHERSTTSDRVTVSIGGITAYPKAAIDVREFVRLADEALYDAKSSGRNRVVLRPSRSEGGATL